MAWVTYFSAVAPGMSLVEKQWLVHGAHTSALQRLVLGPRLEAFSLPLLTLKKQLNSGEFPYTIKVHLAILEYVNMFKGKKMMLGMILKGPTIYEIPNAFILTVF